MTTPLRHEKAFSTPVPVYPPEATEERIARIVEGFDAERVHAVMTLLNWRWGGRDRVKAGVPTAQEIRDSATDLLRRTLVGFVAGKVKSGGGWCSGGLKTHIDDKGELTLTFELCSTFEQLLYEGDAEQPLPAGYACVGDPRAWRKT